VCAWGVARMDRGHNILGRDRRTGGRGLRRRGLFRGGD
jgi:hypothetical protein